MLPRIEGSSHGVGVRCGEHSPGVTLASCGFVVLRRLLPLFIVMGAMFMGCGPLEAATPVRTVPEADSPQTSAPAPKRRLAAVDYMALAGYFTVNLTIGYWCARRKRDSDQYLRGGGRIRWWAAGISYMSTGVSVLSFMTFPAAAYASNWLPIGVPVFQSIAIMLTGLIFVRLLRRLELTTVFEYIQRRFNRALCLLGAALMMLSQIGGRLSIIMLLPAMAFSTVSGLNVYLSIALMGVVTIGNCLKGGLTAVVFTDILQLALIYGGMAVVLVTIANGVPGGFGEVFSVAQAEGKLRAVLTDWDLTRPSLWIFIGLCVTTIFLQLGDQALMQRAFSTPDEKAARKCVVLGGVLILPVAFLLFTIGTGLFVFYRYHPASIDPALPNDSIFPHFIGNELPRGLVGLIIAAMFGEAMSTLSSTINAISAIAVRDFYVPLRPASTERSRLWVAYVTTAAAGALATATAMVMASLSIASLWETFAKLMALIGGGFPGVFALGLLTRRANVPGVVIGFVASVAATFAVRQYTSLHAFGYLSVAVGTCIGVGYLASLLFHAPTRNLEGLTVFTPRLAPAGAERVPSVKPEPLNPTPGWESASR